MGGYKEAYTRKRKRRHRRFHKTHFPDDYHQRDWRDLQGHNRYKGSLSKWEDEVLSAHEDHRERSGYFLWDWSVLGWICSYEKGPIYTIRTARQGTVRMCSIGAIVVQIIFFHTKGHGFWTEHIRYVRSKRKHWWETVHIVMVRGW